MTYGGSLVRLAKDLYGGASSGYGGRRITVDGGTLGSAYVGTGRALSDSVEGRALVDAGGDTVAPSQGVDMPCTVNVRAGDTVIITLVGNDPTVTGVVGRGDQQQSEIDGAAKKATQAQADAKASLTAANLAQKVSDAAKAQAQAAQDAAKRTQGVAEKAQQTANETIKTSQDAQAKAQQAVTNVQAALDKAQSSLDAASKASQDAAAAAGLAKGKSTVLVQDERPSTDYENAQTLWIDTTGGANTPKRWGRLPEVTVAGLAKMLVSAAAARTVSDLASGTSAMGWVNVTDSKAVEAAMAAALAQQTADGKNRVQYSMGEPSGDHAQGDMWWVLDDMGHVVHINMWNGAQWVPYKLVVDELAVPSSVGTVSIKDGAISGDKLQVNSVQAKNITSGAITADKVAAGAITTGKLDMAQMTGDSAFLARLMSAIVKAGSMVAGDPAKAHVVMDGSGLTFYGNDGRTVKMQLQTATGNILMSGYASSGDLSKVSAAQIVDITRSYYSSTSSTALAGGSWSATYPGWADKRYIWVRDDTTYGDGRRKQGTPVMLTGNTGATGPKGDAGTPGRDGAPGKPGANGRDGASGRGISGFSVAYAVSTSGTEKPTSGWQPTIPAVPAGQYLWTRVTYTYTTGDPTSAYTVARQGAQGPQGNAGPQGPQGATGPQGKPGKDGASGRDGRMLYGTCPTPAATADKAVGVPGVASLYAGLTVSVTFSQRNAADDCTLNVSGTGAKPLWAWGERLRRGRSWVAGVPVLCVYDGSKWLVDGGSIAATAMEPTSDGLYIWRHNSAGTVNDAYTLMTGSSMQVYGRSGMAAQFADNRIDLGKSSQDTTISMCRDSVRIYSSSNGSQASAGEVNASYILCDAPVGANNRSSFSIGFGAFSDNPANDMPRETPYVTLGVDDAHGGDSVTIGAQSVRVNWVDWTARHGQATGTGQYPNLARWACSGGLCTVSITHCLDGDLPSWSSRTLATGLPRTAGRAWNLACTQQLPDGTLRDLQVVVDPDGDSPGKAAKVTLTQKGGPGIPHGSWLFVSGTYPLAQDGGWYEPFG